MVSQTKHRMIPASFGDGAVRLALKKLRAGHFCQFRPEQRSRSKGSWFPLISRKPQGDLGRNPACKRHAFSRTQPSLTDRPVGPLDARVSRSEEHTSELQSLMRISYAVFCLKKKIKITRTDSHEY